MCNIADKKCIRQGDVHVWKFIGVGPNLFNVRARSTLSKRRLGGREEAELKSSTATYWASQVFGSHLLT
jgi:hypothetical protein